MSDNFERIPSIYRYLKQLNKNVYGIVSLVEDGAAVVQKVVLLLGRLDGDLVGHLLRDDAAHDHHDDLA